MAHGAGATHSAGTFSLEDGDTLCWLDLRVANDRNLGCRLASVQWFWRDCAHNTLRRNDSLIVARTVIDARRFDECERPLPADTVTALPGGLPNYVPSDDACHDSDVDHPIAPFLTLTNGVARIVCPVEIDDRGDCNLNGVPGDAEDIQCFVDGMLGRCEFADPTCEFLYWTPRIELLQSLFVDSPPCPLPETRDTLVVTGERVSTSDLFAYTFDRPVGAALFEFADSGTTLPVLGVSGMIYESHNTPLSYRYLIYSDTGAVVRASNVISSTEALLNVYAATLDGLPMDVLFNVQTSVAAVDTAITLPREFALKQNFPNPFNPTTTVTFELPRKVEWELAIYNIAGQLVERFTGADGPGVASVSVHSADWASGVYLYRFTAAEFAQSRKMVLLK
ncbi:MAG TPA: T9SS type A sorting domain-containing protein [candidate division Zixibacteria bacterium]|nr:T9SS type A sorting domain-containing protein [candidate division Zixibacteria bacterium]